MKEKKQKYWYIKDVSECVICGKEKIYRYRVYTKPIESLIWRQDACSIHFI